MIDLFTRVLFESLPLLLVAIAVAMAVALAVHRRRFTRGSRRGLVATAGVGVLLIVVQSLVVTDREAIENMLRQAASAVQTGDVPGLAGQIDDEFAAGSMDKQQLLARSNQMLQRWQVNSARLSGFRTDREGDVATVSFRVLCDLRSDAWVQDNTLSLWTLRCVRRPDGWKIQQILQARFGPAGFAQGGGLDILPQIR